jgi:hypothetical protein
MRWHRKVNHGKKKLKINKQKKNQKQKIRIHARLISAFSFSLPPIFPLNFPTLLSLSLSLPLIHTLPTERTGNAHPPRTLAQLRRTPLARLARVFLGVQK